MVKEKATVPSIKKYEIEGHSVQIRKEGDAEQLRIDGVRRRFFMTRDGYNLSDDAYTPPQASLLEAVKAYLKREAAGKGNQ